MEVVVFGLFANTEFYSNSLIPVASFAKINKIEILSFDLLTRQKKDMTVFATNTTLTMLTYLAYVIFVFQFGRNCELRMGHISFLMSNY